MKRVRPTTITLNGRGGGWKILIPQLASPVANTVTTRANQMGATNILHPSHYPINGVLECYAEELQEPDDDAGASPNPD